MFGLGPQSARARRAEQDINNNTQQAAGESAMMQSNEMSFAEGSAGVLAANPSQATQYLSPDIGTGSSAIASSSQAQAPRPLPSHPIPLEHVSMGSSASERLSYDSGSRTLQRSVTVTSHATTLPAYEPPSFSLQYSSGTGSEDVPTNSQGYATIPGEDYDRETHSVRSAVPPSYAATMHEANPNAPLSYDHKTPLS